MDVILRRNERSWAIEMISKINEIVSSDQLMIRRAGGENTISTRQGVTMFPDVLLYGNLEQSMILQGWEIKMPDVPIEDEAFIRDAGRKADALGLNSFLLWNFTYAVLYIKNAEQHFEIARQWDSTSFIRTRQDVAVYRNEWENLLKSILYEINVFFLEGRFRQRMIGEAISSFTMKALISRNQYATASSLRKAANQNSVIAAFIAHWWRGVQQEYERDETDSYSAYAKSVLLNWSNRITFAHIIKFRQNPAMLIDSLDMSCTPKEAGAVFQTITEHCDFYNIFVSLPYDTILPEEAWADLMEYSVFLRDNGIQSLDQAMLQNILEGTVSQAKRSLNGQFTTPEILARILVKITVINWEDDFLDCCCGTGTIAKAALELKKQKIGIRRAVETVWASDKYTYPLQTANISMASADTVNLANRVFQSDVLELSAGDSIMITDPETGLQSSLVLPKVGSIASNLPFVESGKISDVSPEMLEGMQKDWGLSARSDLSFYAALKAADLLKDGGRLGIITSNSWMGTDAGNRFFEALKRRYSIKQIHFSGCERWFENADVVTAIMILQKGPSKEEDRVQFFLWNKRLEELEEDMEAEDLLVQSALLGKDLNSDVARISEYPVSEINLLRKINVSYNAFFHGIQWLESFRDLIVPIQEIFHVFRGTRRGWDALFYPKPGDHHIEAEYLKKVLFNARSVQYLIAVPDRDAFVCDAEIETLQRRGHYGALEWIGKFMSQKNRVGKPLQEALAQGHLKWYEMQRTEVAELFTMMNPDKRFFFARFQGAPASLNQRLIGLIHRPEYEDIELYHALLNSVFTMFSIEASGFGRGLGVLDINKDSLAKCRMLDPRLIGPSDRDKILDTFSKLKQRKILPVEEELMAEDRISFERTVFSAYGVLNELPLVIRSLQSLQKTRTAAKSKRKSRKRI